MTIDLDAFYAALRAHPGLSNRQAALAAGLPEELTPEQLVRRMGARCLKARYDSAADGWFFDDSPGRPAARNASPIDFPRRG